MQHMKSFRWNEGVLGLSGRVWEWCCGHFLGGLEGRIEYVGKGDLSELSVFFKKRFESGTVSATYLARNHPL